MLINTLYQPASLTTRQHLKQIGNKNDGIRLVAVIEISTTKLRVAIQFRRA